MPDTGSITVVPSVHFSPVHRQRVRETIREERPDVVAVELDADRFERLERDAGRTPRDIAREMPPPTAATYNLLRTIQRTVARLYGLDPGTTDMEVAVETAAELDAEVALIDEPIAETIAALTDRIGFDTLPKMVMRAQRLDPAEQMRGMQVVTTPFSAIESGEDVQPAIEQMRLLLPEVTDVLIDRRDRAMARRLHALREKGHDVVAVVGAGHHLGIERHLEELSEVGPDGEISVPVRRPSRDVTKIPIE